MLFSLSLKAPHRTYLSIWVSRIPLYHERHCGEIAPRMQTSYNVNLLGISLAVGRLTLDQLGQVRILDPQPLAKLVAVAQMRELRALQCLASEGNPIQAR
jgi:hypothetical protein